MITSHLAKIDINADIAEGYDFDSALLPYISSANIACGIHAGNPDLMMDTLKMCQHHKVACGAHPSYPDRENFGRLSLNISPSSIYHHVITQISALNGLAHAQGMRLQHVKPHGALYNDCANDEHKAMAVIDAIKSINPEFIIFGLAESKFLKLAEENGMKTVHEAFADRCYTEKKTLVARSQAHAVITNVDQAISQVLRIIQTQSLCCETGNDISLKAQSICIHGDNQHALVFAQKLHSALQQNTIAITHF